MIGNDIFTVVRAPARDWQGDPSGAATETPVDGCLWQPGTSTETTATGDTVITGGTGWLPAGADIVATDRVRLSDGSTYAVSGRPERWHDEMGAEQYVEASFRLVEGA